MTDAFLCDYVRTPIGRYGGALAPVRTDDLAAVPLRELMRRHGGVDWHAVDDMILGCANQAGEDNRNVARMAALLAGLPVGLPVGVPGTTVNRLCGSGLDAVLAAGRMIRSGEAHLVIAGGVESMSRAPLVMPKAESACSLRATIHDTVIGWRFVNPAMAAAYGVESMPETAENVAAVDGISREDQDAFALHSQQKAAASQQSGRFAREIVGVPLRSRTGDVAVVERDDPRGARPPARPDRGAAGRHGGAGAGPDRRASGAGRHVRGRRPGDRDRPGTGVTGPRRTPPLRPHDRARHGRPRRRHASPAISGLATGCCANRSDSATRVPGRSS